MFATAIVTLKQHRFEILAALVAAAAALAMGLLIALRIGALNVSDACLASVAGSSDFTAAEPNCLSLVQAGSEIIGEIFLTGEGSLALSVMGVLPVLLGLLGGVPLVARELEARTAQTAWSLNGSRMGWLVRQSAPVILVLGTAMALAAAVAVPVADASVAWGLSGSSLIGLHGPLALLRAFAAFGIGLGIGAALGRALPAFVIGGAMMIAVSLAADAAQTTWTAAQEPQPIASPSFETGESQVEPRAITTGWGVRTPDGELLSDEEGRGIATAAGVPPASEHDDQDVQALEWYAANGYTLVQMGVSDTVALGWAPYDGLIFGIVGLFGLLIAAVAVNLARPV